MAEQEGLVPEEVLSGEDELKYLDEKWGDRLREVINFDILHILQPVNIAEQKEKFLSGEIENPEFDYGVDEKIDVDECEGRLLELKRDILKEEGNEIIKTLYRRRINTSLASLRMMRAMKEGDDRRFYAYSEFLYGDTTKEEEELVRQEIFATILKVYREADSEETRNELKKVLESDYFQGLNEKDFESEEKEEATEKIELDQGQLAELFKQVLSEYGWEDSWDVKNIPDLVAIKVQRFGTDVPTIKIPEGKKVDIDQARKLIAHEIETHVLRAESGKKSKLKLLEIGLDRYLATEEGLATYNQQNIYNEEKPGKQAGLWEMLSLAISKNHNFRETFEILRGLGLANTTKTIQGNLEEAKKRASNLAWDRTVRVFRGTNDMSSKEGYRYTKDIVYRRGNIAVWDFADTRKDEMKRLYVGKVGIQHLEMLWELGIKEPAIEPRMIGKNIVDIEKLTRKR